MVAADRDGGIGLVDLVTHGAAGVVVVAGGIGKGDRITDRPRRGIGADRATEVQARQALALDAGRAARGRVAVAIVGDMVAADRDRGIGLVDLVAHGAAGVVVVAGGIGKGDRITDRPRRGIGADRATEVQARQALALDAGRAARGRVAVAIVGDMVAVDRDGGI